MEKTRADFGFDIAGQDAPEPDAGDIESAGYMAQVGNTVAQSAPQCWEVEPDRIALGFFSFNKLLMYLDLDPDNTAIAENEIIAAIFGDWFREPPLAINGNARLDSHVKPQDAYHVMDADSSQSLAIYDAAVGSGRNLVSQGPAGA